MEKKKEKNLLEKITFYTGLLTLAVLFGYLATEIYRNESKPPELEIRIIEDQADSFKYKIEVENKGEETAEAAMISFDFYRDNEVKAKAELQIDYVPVKSMEVGWIVFPGQIAPADSIVVSSLSYIDP